MEKLECMELHGGKFNEMFWSHSSYILAVNRPQYNQDPILWNIKHCSQSVPDFLPKTKKWIFYTEDGQREIEICMYHRNIIGNPSQNLSF